jgi:hypothetical protein
MQLAKKQAHFESSLIFGLFAQKFFELFCRTQKEQVFKADTTFFEVHSGAMG